MKMKNIMIITFLLLAVLTIGAASAADDVASDNMTVSDDADIVAAEDDDPYEDSEITVNEDPICIDESNEDEYDENDTIAEISLPDNADGSVKIFNGNELITSLNVDSNDDDHWEIDDEFGTIDGTLYLKDFDLNNIHDGDTLSFQYFEKGKDVPIDSLTILCKVTLTETTMKLTEIDEYVEDVEVTYYTDESFIMEEGWDEYTLIEFTVKAGIDGRIVIYINNTLAFNKPLNEIEREFNVYTVYIKDLNVDKEGEYPIESYFYDNNGEIIYNSTEDEDEQPILSVYESQTVPVDGVRITVIPTPVTITGNESFIIVDSSASEEDNITVYIDNEKPITIKLNNTRTDEETGDYLIGSKELKLKLKVGEHNVNITYKGKTITGKKINLTSNIVITFEKDIVYSGFDNEGFIFISLDEGEITDEEGNTITDGKINLTIMDDTEIIDTIEEYIGNLPTGNEDEDGFVIRTTDMNRPLNGTYKVIVRYFDGNEANTTAEGTVTFKIFTPEDYGTSINTTIKNKTASIITFKDIPLSEDILAEIDGNPIDISELIDGDSEEGYYIKYNQLNGLVDGTHSIRVYLNDDDYTELASGTVFVDVEENIDLNLTISVANIEEGNVATVIITTNNNFTGAIAVQIGASNYSVNVVKGQGSIPVASLKANTYTATALFKSDGIFTDATKAATFTVTAKPAAPSTPAAPAKKVIKLTLKKVKVKKSAKKLVLKATLKINGKAPKKGTKIKFTFKGKKYIGKTNKKGVAKVTIKKKVLKKLKVGKKVKYTAKYSTKTVKRTAKVKR